MRALSKSKLLAYRQCRKRLWLPLRRRASQTVALIDLVKKVPNLEDAQIKAWVEQEITGRVIPTVRSVIDRYLTDSLHDDAPRETLLDHAERDLIVELEESKAIGLVGRFDGENGPDREVHRRNFNRRHNPFVMLVGQVGEEGIDLQEQCRYVTLHAAGRRGEDRTPHGRAMESYKSWSKSSINSRI
jgi:hypothetical protein